MSIPVTLRSDYDAIRLRQLARWSKGAPQTCRLRVFTSYNDILDHCCAAWTKLMDQPWTIMSIGVREWARNDDQWDFGIT